MATDVRDLGTILGVWAHPDDETYLSAALMSVAAHNGQRVTCDTATRGEKGPWDEQRSPSEPMGAVREAELLECLRILGVKDHRWLDYVDAECSDVPFEEAVGKIVAIMEEVEPASVLTFGPDGMTDHADHKAVHAWTTEAFRRAAKPGARLYYATQTQEWVDKYVPILQQFNVFGPGTPPVTPVGELGINLRIDGELLERKVAAILAHDSQVDGMTSVFGEKMFFDSNQNEWFRL